MSNPAITGDSSNVNITNANLVVANDIFANAFFNSNGLISSSDVTSNLHTILENGNITSNSITASFFLGDGGLLSNIQGGGGTPNLQQVTTSGATTTDTVILEGGIVTGNVSTAISVIDNTISLDMGGLSYKTFSCSTSNNISNVTITNDISGTQGIVFIDATGDISVDLTGTNVHVSFSNMEVSTGEKALVLFTSDGTEKYFNAVKYPSALITSNLDQIVTQGNTTDSSINVGGLTATANVDAGNSYVSGTVTAGSFVGDGSGLTGISGGGGGGTSVQECFDAYPSTSQNVTTLTQILLDTERYNSNSSVFSLNTGTGTLTVNKSSLYMINYTASTGISSGSSRSLSKGTLYINGSAETATSVYMYNRNLANDDNTGSQTIIKQLTSGDTIGIRCERISGTDTIASTADGTGLRVLEILS